MITVIEAKMVRKKSNDLMVTALTSQGRQLPHWEKSNLNYRMRLAA